MIEIVEYLKTKNISINDYPLSAWASNWRCNSIEWEEIAPMLVEAIGKCGYTASELLQEISEYKDVNDYTKEWASGNLHYNELENELIDLLEDAKYSQIQIDDITYELMMESYDIFKLMVKENISK